MAKKKKKNQKKKKNHLKQAHHIIWIIAGLSLIILTVFGIRLFIDAQKYFP